MQFLKEIEHEHGIQTTKKPKNIISQLSKDPRRPKLVRPSSQNEINPPSTFVQFKVPNKSKEEKHRLKPFTPRPLVQFTPSIQPFTSSDAINPLRQEIATENTKLKPHTIRTKGPRIPFFGPNSFRPSPRIPSTMFVPVSPGWRCSPGPECLVVAVQNVTFKTVKPFISAQPSTPPSTFQGWWSTVGPFY